MSTYPGEGPSSSGEQPDDGTEPTQPVGYWEQQAAERARAQQPSQHPDQQPPGQQWGQQPGPQYPSRPGQTSPYSTQQPSPQPAPGYGGPPAAASGPPLYDAPTGYGAPPPYVGGYAPPGPDHPQATVAMVLGIVGLLGGFTCGLPLLVSPFAWFLGRKAVKEIRASQGRVGGDGQAMAGMVMGIIGTLLLVLGVLLLAMLIIVAIASDTSGTTTGSTI